MREAELGIESLFGLSPPPPVRAVYSASPLLPHFHEGREVRKVISGIITRFILKGLGNRGRIFESCIRIVLLSWFRSELY